MLRYRADLRTLAFVASFFGLVSLGYVVGTRSWAFTGLLVVVTSLFSFFCAVITHNTIHAPIFTSRPLNKAFQVVLTLAYGHPVSMFVPGHNLSHHRHAQTAKDLMRTTKLRWSSNALNVLLFTSTVTPGILRDNIRYAKAQRTRKPAWFRQLVIEGVVMVAVFLVLLAIDWKSFLLYVAIPHQFAQWGIVAINFPQHDGCDAEHPYNHSRNFTGTVLNFFTFNNGFHGMHHMKPALHWSLLPEAHETELRPFIHPNLDHQSLAGWAWRTMVWPGERLDYEGNPVVLAGPVPDEEWIPTLIARDQDVGQTGAIDDGLDDFGYDDEVSPAA